MAPERIFRARHASRGSMRKVRGSGWHRKGYRDLGEMWINVNEGHYTRGRDVGETDSLADFAHSLDEPGRDGFWCDVFFRKKSIFDLAEENPGDVVEDWFDGGETVYRKVRIWQQQEREIASPDGYVPTGKRAHRCRFGSPERDEFGQIVGPEEPQPPLASMPQPRNRLALELASAFAEVQQEAERYALSTPAERRRMDEEDMYPEAYMVGHNYPRGGPVHFEPPVRQQPQVLQEYRPPPPLTLAQRQAERAVGRTPEEIIALERALAARRARRARRQA